MNKSIAEGHRLSEMQKRKAEQEKLRQEQEKARQEEQAKVLAESGMKKQEEFQNKAFQKAENSQEPVKQWVSFSALLLVADAQELAGFFKSRNIEFKKR